MRIYCESLMFGRTGVSVSGIRGRVMVDDLNPIDRLFLRESAAMFDRSVFGCSHVSGNYLTIMAFYYLSHVLQ